MLLPLLLSLGQWQNNKAERKAQLQQDYLQRAGEEPLHLDTRILMPADRYRQVTARGQYVSQYQILLDNQVHQGRVGYQLVTPLKIEGSDRHVLVYRGWLPAGKDRNIIPLIETPTGLVEVTGIADRPSGQYLELESQNTANGWQPVWQNLDIRRYQASVPFAVQEMAIRLAPDSNAGGYVRDWPVPDAKVDMHRGYAFQWYALAVMLTLYYLFTQFRKPSESPQHVI